MKVKVTKHTFRNIKGQFIVNENVVGYSLDGVFSDLKSAVRALLEAAAHDVSICQISRYDITDLTTGKTVFKYSNDDEARIRPRHIQNAIALEKEHIQHMKDEWGYDVDTSRLTALQTALLNMTA